MLIIQSGTQSFISMYFRLIRCLKDLFYLDLLFQTSNVQTFQPIILIYLRSYFVYHHWRPIKEFYHRKIGFIWLNLATSLSPKKNCLIKTSCLTPPF